MSGVFEHSIRVPRLYKTVAKIVQTVREDGASLKQLVYLKKHPNIKALYALALTTLQYGSQLDQLIRRTKILVNEPRLDPWLARVLITELLWRKEHLSSECKPVKTILSYEKLLRDELKNTKEFEKPGAELKVEKPRYVRVNTLSKSVEEAIESFKEEGWRQMYRSKDYSGFIEDVSKLCGRTFIQDIHVPELLIFPPKTQFYDHPGYINGGIILQDKASCLPAYLLNAQPGSTVLDMCASPGMKTTHLAAMLKNKGKIYAVEINERRYQTLCEIVESTNSSCVETVHADVITLNAQKCPNVEYILVDPSCSGSGMLDRPGIDSNEKCAPGRLRTLQSFQVMILRHALLTFPKARRIVYSTCSLYPEENEQVIDDVLSQIGDSYKLVPAKTLMNNNWLNYSSTDYTCKDNCLYARPETDLSNGFFVAVFERNFDVPLPEIKRRKNKFQNEKKSDENGGENFESKAETEEMEVHSVRVEENIKHNGSELIADEKKKKKKKRKHNEENEIFESKAENGETELQNVIVEENIKNNESEIIPDERKKKKKKRRHNEEDETGGDQDKIGEKLNYEIALDTGSKKKKKNCKKSRDREVETIEKNEEPETEKKKKSKKLKRKHDLTEIEEKS